MDLPTASVLYRARASIRFKKLRSEFFFRASSLDLRPQPGFLLFDLLGGRLKPRSFPFGGINLCLGVVKKRDPEHSPVPCGGPSPVHSSNARAGVPEGKLLWLPPEQGLGIKPCSMARNKQATLNSAIPQPSRTSFSGKENSQLGPPGSALLSPVSGGGFLYILKLSAEKGYPYSNLSTGGPRQRTGSSIWSITSYPLWISQEASASSPLWMLDHRAR